MPIALYRIDDRLIHGQVIVGWGQPLDLQVLHLVDDEVSVSDWEQELYRMGVPPEMTVQFFSADDAAAILPSLQSDPRPGILLVGDVTTMKRLVDAANGTIPAVNVGGIHHAPGRVAKMRYVFLTPTEEAELKAIADMGVVVTAQDVPSARPVPLAEVLAGTAES